MRLWSLHPKYLDPRGLVALWREALLAQKVLQGATRGYRSHPQLARFRSHSDPLAAIASYLSFVLDEAVRRGYSFNAQKIATRRTTDRIPCTRGQLRYEWEHLKQKLRSRNPAAYLSMRAVSEPEPHPWLFLVEGGPEPWEAVPKDAEQQNTKKRAEGHKIP